MNLRFQKVKGVTLLEVLLVLVIASSLVVLMLNYSTQKADQMRRDKTTLQIQQLLNAAMSFYVSNSYWPMKAGASVTNPQCDTTSWAMINKSQLQPNFIPSTFLNNPYAQPYEINCSSDVKGGGFYVSTTIGLGLNLKDAVNAQIVAANLPLAFVTDKAGMNSNPPQQSSTCAPGSSLNQHCNIVVSSVSIPGQNLNNARSVNYAGVFHSGSCVPAPVCPPGMQPSITVAVSGATGIFGDVSCTGSSLKSCTGTISSINSFTAFARGDKPVPDPDPKSYPGTIVNPVDPNSPGPLDCDVTGTPAAQPCWETQGSTFPATKVKYWRVCLTVTTEQGIVYPKSTDAYGVQKGKIMGNIIAFTRCVPNSGGETPQGSFDVWQQNPNFTP